MSGGPPVRGLRALSAAWSALIALAAGCNAILGNQDATDVPVADGGNDSGGADVLADTSSPRDRQPPGDGAPLDGKGDAPTDAVPVEAPGCESDASFTGDPKNCGACGHDCLGGACVGGACQPMPLFTGISDVVTALAVDDTNLYWGDGAGVSYGSKQPPSVAMVFASTGFVVAALAVDTASVFWTDQALSNGNLYTCPKPPASCTPSMLAALPFSGGLALDSVNVYWSENGTPGGVFSCPKSGPCVGGTPISMLSDVPAVVTAAGQVFWTSAGVLYGYGGGNTAMLFTGASGAFRLGADDMRLYWSDNTDQSLWSCTIAACDGGVVAAPGFNGLISQIVSDGTAAYWGDSTGALYRYAAPSGVALIAYFGPNQSVSALAVDSAAVFIAVSFAGGSNLVKLAK